MDERLDKALTSLSEARTALSDPGALDGEWREPSTPASKAPVNYAIDKIDDAMRLLGANEEEGAIEYDLQVSIDGVFGGQRPFDAVEETIEAVGEALELKKRHPSSVVGLLVVERS